MEELLGEIPNVLGLHGLAREKRLLEIYRRNLKRQMPAKSGWPSRSAYVRVLHREKERPKYHLVYLTSHPHGIVVFMEISEKLEPGQRLVRATTKQATESRKVGKRSCSRPRTSLKQDKKR